jgi:hypothetical protein
VYLERSTTRSGPLLSIPLASSEYEVLAR